MYLSRCAISPIEIYWAFLPVGKRVWGRGPSRGEGLKELEKGGIKRRTRMKVRLHRSGAGGQGGELAIGMAMYLRKLAARLWSSLSVYFGSSAKTASIRLISML